MTNSEKRSTTISSREAYERKLQAQERARRIIVIAIVIIAWKL